MKCEWSMRHVVAFMVKKKLNELRGDIIPDPVSGGRCDYDSDCPGWSHAGGISQPRCINFKCVKGASRPSNN